MKVALLGATGFIGSAVLEEALEAGHEVAALVRSSGRISSRPRLRVVVGDAGDPQAVDDVVAGSDAVISALGTRRGEKAPVDFLAGAMANVLQAMERHGVRRLVAISGAGISVEGERKPFPHNLISAMVRLAARDIVEAKQREYEVLRASSADWTAVRPTRVVDGPARDHPKLGTSVKGLGMRVSRRTLARVLVRQLDDVTFVRRVPLVSE